MSPIRVMRMPHGPATFNQRRGRSGAGRVAPGVVVMAGLVATFAFGAWTADASPLVRVSTSYTAPRLAAASRKTSLEDRFRSVLASRDGRAVLRRLARLLTDPDIRALASQTLTRHGARLNRYQKTLLGATRIIAQYGKSIRALVVALPKRPHTEAILRSLEIVKARFRANRAVQAIERAGASLRRSSQLRETTAAWAVLARARASSPAPSRDPLVREVGARVVDMRSAPRFRSFATRTAALMNHPQFSRAVARLPSHDAAVFLRNDQLIDLRLRRDVMPRRASGDVQVALVAVARTIVVLNALIGSRSSSNGPAAATSGTAPVVCTTGCSSGLSAQFTDSTELQTQDIRKAGASCDSDVTLMGVATHHPLVDVEVTAVPYVGLPVNIILLFVTRILNRSHTRVPVQGVVPRGMSGRLWADLTVQTSKGRFFIFGFEYARVTVQAMTGAVGEIRDLTDLMCDYHETAP